MATSLIYKESNLKILKEFIFRNTERVRKLNPCLDVKFNTLNTKIITSEMTTSHKYIGFLVQEDKSKLLKIVPWQDLKLIESEDAYPNFVENNIIISNPITINSILFRQGIEDVIACLDDTNSIKVYDVVDETRIAKKFKLRLNLINSINSLPNIKFFRWIPKENHLFLLIVFGPKHSQFCVWDVLLKNKIEWDLQEEIIDIASNNDKILFTDNFIVVSTRDEKIAIFEVSYVDEIKLNLKHEFEEIHNQKIVFLEENLLFTCGKRRRSSSLASFIPRSFRYKIFHLKVIF